MRRYAPWLAAALILSACSSEQAPGNEAAVTGEAGFASNVSDEELADIPPPPPIPEENGGDASENSVDGG